MILLFNYFYLVQSYSYYEGQQKPKIYLRERERERERGGGREGERERNLIFEGCRNSESNMIMLVGEG